MSGGGAVALSPPLYIHHCQKSLLTFFAKDADATEKQVQQQPMLSVTESDVSVEGNQNDITDSRQSPQGTSTSVDAQAS